MNVRLLFLPAIAVLLLTFGTFAAACDGDGGQALTLEEYFQRLEQLDKDKDDR